MEYRALSREQLQSEYEQVVSAYNKFKDQKLNLDMSRGKPGSDQLDLAMGMMDVLTSKDILNTENGLDVRNYGVLDGIPEAKRLFADMFSLVPNEIIIGGNSSLNLMYDTIAKAMLFGMGDTEDMKSWCKLENVKFLCPVPGYDRHFAICETLGIQMINISMDENGPDMDEVERLVKEDDSIKGIWCVPKYSNPDGITYSDDVVRRLANLSPKAKDFRIFWDNAYNIHHISDTPDELLDIFAESKKVGKEDMIIIFGSTSKISFSGAGVAIVASSINNINFMKKHLTIQTIGFDKINQLRHVKFFKDMDGVMAHMEKHRKILKPKFDAVLSALDQYIKPLDIATWKNPSGGYFVSLNTMNGCAKRTVALCKEAGVVMTGAGATYPYGKDSDDKNIRIAPTYPPVDELVVAMELFCVCVKLATLEKLLAE